MNFSIVNLGCKVNRVESDTLDASLRAQGACESSLEHAQLVVVNTCTVTGEAEKKTRKAIRRVLRNTNDAVVVVTGCAAAINPTFYEEMDSRIRVVPKGSLESFARAFFQQHNATSSTKNLATSEKPSLHLEQQDVCHFAERVGESFPTRVGIKIQDGCNHACTYCIVHIARGKAASRDWQSVLHEVCALEKRGVKEIVLTGIDLGSYFFEGKGLSELLEILLEHTRGIRFRISSIEPTSFDKNLVALIKEAEGRICRHLHLPLQSGSTKVLEEMHRPYTANDYASLCDMLLCEIPHLSLSTDIIVGFPGETEKDFFDTLQLAQQVGFSKIHVFRYSPRQGTPAAARCDQIAPALKEKRAYELSEVGKQLRLQYGQNFIGKSCLVVVEKKGWAMTESYYHVRVASSFKPGSLQEVTIVSVDSQGVLYT